MAEKQERIVHATKVLCEQCEEKGVEICSFETMPGYNSFVEGAISEVELAEQARQEMAEFVQKFQKYIVVQREASKAEEEKDSKLKRAKIANKIYKKACSETGKSFCFFNNFSSWQEYVEGRIDDDDLYKKAKEEIENLAKSV